MAVYLNLHVFIYFCFVCACVCVDWFGNRLQVTLDLRKFALRVFDITRSKKYYN